ncbi:5'-3' exoribonuclease 2 [Kickxella alabastrina]|uniref:5'-3' exoribonuclease 2 n=1 Tax=Kickxella alabastrina TaxID=61397 RepID=A0ACC1IWG0_9FUNG|nr:5'-3' exoribonuclease 2 [Kickxella alabastrina]
MGVAAFYRWLTRKYPRVQSRVIEERPQIVNDIEIPVDATKPNPNGVEFDNLYLDMNGIVHPCCHPQFRDAPETEEDMMIEVFKCLDRVFNMVRPRKIVYMALDGVAPRAKMNQQRSRRFRAAQEAEEKEADQAKVVEEIFQATGERPPQPEKAWDSNCITPGTPFMELLAKSLRYYIVTKLNSDPAWKSVKVVLSDSNVPGEGEHKIMDYIRRQRMMPAHDPNTTHVLYGLDADLIMLSLATHEPYFKILREDVAWADMLTKPCRQCGKKGHFERECKGRGAETPNTDFSKQPFVFAHIEILREYLEYELKPTVSVPFPFDLERAIDDWVFLCFFVGNDFLPHLPSLEIREGALEKLIQFWKDGLPASGGYITHNGDVDMFRVQPIMDRIAAIEEDTFKERKIEEAKRERNNQRYNQRNNRDIPDGQARLDAAADEMAAVGGAKLRKEAEEAEKKSADAKNFAAASALKARLAGRAAPTPAPLPVGQDEDGDEIMVSGVAPALASSTKRSHEESLEKDDLNGGDAQTETVELDTKLIKLNDGEKAAVVEPKPVEDEAIVAEDIEAKTVDDAASVSIVDDSEAAGDSEVPVEDPFTDTVKFHESGYKDRYYNLKFGFSANDKESVHKVVEHYVRGLCWVLKYYYQGCVSWSWYYPYHYAPLASDFVDLDIMDVSFDLSAPLRPYEQLMGVLPAASRHHLPEPFGRLMTSETSPIIDFYPTDFPLDLNGKKFLWQAVILLPFIESERLLKAVGQVYPYLTPEEEARNSRGSEIVMVSSAHPLYESLCDLYNTSDPNLEVPLDPKLSQRMSGTVSIDPNYVPHTAYESPLHTVDKPDIEEDRSISVIYHQPQPDSSHTAVLLPGLRLPGHVLNSADIEFMRTGGKSGFRGPPRTYTPENNRDFRDFYGQQGNDVSRDRGRGPSRYDQQGNVNPEYQSYHSGRGQSRPYARPRYPNPSHQSRGNNHGNNYGNNGGNYGNNGGNYGNSGGQSGYNSRPPPPRPMGYQPFGGRPPAAQSQAGGQGGGAYNGNNRGRGGGGGGYHGGNTNGGGSRGGYRGGYRGRGGNNNSNGY